MHVQNVKCCCLTDFKLLVNKQHSRQKYFMSCTKLAEAYMQHHAHLRAFNSSANWYCKKTMTWNVSFGLLW